MRIAIVEDAADARALLAALIERYARERGLDVEILPFKDGEDFLKDYPKGLSVALLDIEMARLNGMDTARAVRRFDARVQLVFVTCMVQYAIQGYSVDAADFIAKPADYPSLCAAMDRALARARFFAPRFLDTSYNRESVRCQVQQIACIESFDKKTLIHMADGTVLRSSEPLYALEEKLAGEAFFRCHNAFLVNLGQVRTVGATELTVPELRVPISKHRKKAFFQSLAACRGRIL